jgi:aminopeptidase
MAVKPGDNVYIKGIGSHTYPMIEALVKEVYAAGGRPYTQLMDELINREFLMGLTQEQIELHAQFELDQMRHMDCFVSIRGNENILETSDVPASQVALYEKVMRKVIDERVNNTRWVVLRWPSPTMAQSAGMSTRAFEDFYFNACLIEYAELESKLKPLQELMERTDEVRITSPNGTDLKFSIKGIAAIPCCGLRNIPDGEIFTAPVRDSVQGVIQYNTPTVYQGKRFEGVHLEFKDGKIIAATCSNGADEDLNAIFDADEGARFVGEFALGVNNAVTTPMLDILFDEKIGGSLHFTPGQAYEEADNGNRSQIHWDMVLDQRAHKGGGKVFFDGVLIREDGLFVLDELKSLNP